MSEPESYSTFRKQIQAHRRHLSEALVSNQLASDRTVLTLAGGALLFSVTLLVDAFGCPRALELLKVAWLLLSMSLVSVAASYRFTIRETRARMEKIDEWLERDQNNDEPEDVGHRVSEFLNSSGLFTMILGLVLLAVFSSINLS